MLLGIPLSLTRPSGQSSLNLSEGAGTMRAFGDSITAGSNATTNANRWANIVATQFGQTLSNQGIGGTVLQNSNMNGGAPQSQNGRDTYDGRLLNSGGSVYYRIQYGLNDLRYKALASDFSVANFQNDLSEVVAALMLAGKTARNITLASPPWIPDAGYSSGSSGFTGSNRTEHELYVAAVRAVAVEHGTKYVDVYAYMRDNGGASLIDTDNIHPTDAGHAVIAQAHINRMTLPNPRSPVSGLSLIASNLSELTASWDAYSGATGYEAQVGTEAITPLGFSASPSGASRVFTGLPNGDYRMRVRAVLAGGLYSPWAYVSTPVTVTDVGDTIVYSDEFTDTAGTLLESHTANLGTWSKGTGSTSSAVITSEGAVRHGAQVTHLHTYSLGALSGTTVYAEAVLDIKSNTANLTTALFLKGDNVANGLDGFVLMYNGSTLRIMRFQANTPTVVATHTQTLTVGQQYTIRLECDAAAQRMYLDGSLVGSSASSDPAGVSDLCGIRLQASTVAGSDTTGAHIRSVEFGTL